MSSRKSDASRRGSDNNLQQYSNLNNPLMPTQKKTQNLNKNNGGEYDLAYAIAEAAEPEIPTASILDRDPLPPIGDYKRGSKAAEAATGIKRPVQSNHEKNANMGGAWPASLRSQIVKSFKQLPNETRGNSFLEKSKWPEGLRATVFKSCKKIAFRFFIVDDSGSMIINDGRRLVSAGTQQKMIKCTRWSELSEAMIFQAQLSEALGAPSEFRLLNGADPIVVGLGDDNGESLKFFEDVMAESPAGQTPLCEQIRAVVASIQSIATELRAGNQKVAVIIASDGESSDGNVADALRPLTNMPVLVILRLCTEEFQVVDYWNNIDNQLELDIDVLDDQLGDAKQVQQHNGWLTYGEPLHRMREFGASMKEMDIIDESAVSSEQMRIICAHLFLGGNPRDLPHPGADWGTFLSKIKELNATIPKVFCPITNSMKPWIDVTKLHRMYGNENSSNNSIACTIM